jgi:hypothetical protein
MASRSLICAIVMVGFMNTPALATSEVVFETYQPLSFEEGIWIASVPYMRFVTASSGELELSYTCAPNAVLGELKTPGNCNIASVSRIRIAMSLNREKNPPGLYGDTVRVSFDLSELPDTVRLWGEPVDTVVAATYECLLANASRVRGAMWVEVRVVGPARFARYGGVYRLADFPVLPRRRYFQ